MASDSSAVQESVFSASAALVAKSVARALGVFVAYAVVGSVWHWVAFWIAAPDIWATFHGGPMGAHAGGVAIVMLVVLLFTPQGLVTAIYLVGLPALCLLLGQHAALRAAVHRMLREKQSALVEFAIAASMRVASAAGKAPGAERAGDVARRLLDSTRSMDASRATRFLLSALLRAIRLPEVLSTTDLVSRCRTDPEGARTELRAAIEPRILVLGRPASFRPLFFLLAASTVATMTRAWWCGFLQ